MEIYSSREAVRVIRAEHDRFKAVIYGMLHFARCLASGDMTIEPKVFRAMLLYIREYPEKVHHPKEDQHLFLLLRTRTSTVDSMLDELERQHVQGERFLRQLEDALTYYELQGEPALQIFSDLVEAYAAFYFNHMKTEETQILPAAGQFLTPEDWMVIDAAFKENRDPLDGTDYKTSLDSLFSLIANIAPPPIGLGNAA